MATYTLSATIARSYAEVLEETRTALAHEGFGILTEIDLAATLKADFPILNHPAENGRQPLVFLDTAASSQKPQTVIDAITLWPWCARASRAVGKARPWAAARRSRRPTRSSSVRPVAAASSRAASSSTPSATHWAARLGSSPAVSR